MAQNSVSSVMLLVSVLTVGCGDGGSDDPDGSSNDGEGGEGGEGGVTYWQDVAPIYYQSCGQCHQAGGIGGFSLLEYDGAVSAALSAKAATAARTMPPWAVTSDGSCGAFVGSLALTDAEIATIGNWVDGGTREGTPAQLEVPSLPGINGAEVVMTPNFLPEIVGGPLSEFDEYRCFLIDELEQARILTSYDVIPGNVALVHHVLVFSLDPAATAEGGVNNSEHLAALDAQSPDRLGWPCFGGAGDGVRESGNVVNWGPGQGVVTFPGDTGVRLGRGTMLVAQVHYNMADASLVGQSDTTEVHLGYSAEVAREGFFVLPDGFLETLSDDEPAALMPGHASVVYSWERSYEELGLEGMPSVDLYGVTPHMHGFGRKLRVTMVDGASEQCVADVQAWDFHWQRMYMRNDPIRMRPGSKIRVRCEYDTTSATDPIAPGWGTRNEMCLSVLYLVPGVG